MGLNQTRAYLDSCLVIYLIEEHPIFASRLEKVIASRQNIIFAVSHLTVMESLVIPLRRNNQSLIDKYQDWFDYEVEMLSLNENVFQQAARLRADFKSLKTPDALHLATAQFYGCGEFWTNDNRLDNIAPGFVHNIL